MDMLIYLDNNRYYSNKFMMGIIYSILGPFILPFVTIYTIIENCNLFHFKWK
jgi:rRNA processing protein Gar1